MKAGDAGRRMISGGMRTLFAPLCTLKWLGLYEMQSAQPREVMISVHAKQIMSCKIVSSLMDSCCRVQVRTEFLEEVEQAFKEW